MPEFGLLLHRVPATLVALGLRQLAVHVEAAGLKEGDVSEGAVDDGLGALLGSLAKVGQQGLNDSAENPLVVSGDLSPVKVRIMSRSNEDWLSLVERFSSGSGKEMPHFYVTSTLSVLSLQLGHKYYLTAPG